MHCPLRYLTGIPCPVCGMTRAFISLLHLRFRTAFYYHPLFPVVLLVILYLLYRRGHERHFSPRAEKALGFLVLALFGGVYLYRLFILHSPVVTPHINQGLFYRIFNGLSHLFYSNSYML